ncbi:MAG: dockerin type I repeat-containing protein [Clostridia bacterium]|nr:dockerin type I repeat-containing protein [Clostridia bacterium]
MKKILSIILAIIAVFTISISAFAETKPYDARMGDVNGDGKVTASDARLVLRVSANLSEKTDDIKAYGDINGDNKITASDARIILRVAASLENLECVMTGHNMAETVIEPTCTNEGYTTNACTRCNYTDGAKTNIMPKLMHGYRFDRSVKATCAAEGYDLYKCMDCGSPTKTKIQPATGHSFKKGNAVKATCISDGYTEYKCSACGIVEKRDIIKAGGHNYEYVSKETVFVKDIGNFIKATKKCSYCNKVIEVYDNDSSNIQVPTTLIHSEEAYAIKEKYDVPYYIEGCDVTGKKLVIYGSMYGIDANGYYYNLDGTLHAPCPNCGKVFGLGKGMCDGGCRLSWG